VGVRACTQCMRVYGGSMRVYAVYERQQGESLHECMQVYASVCMRECERMGVCVREHVGLSKCSVSI
jgi:hypothetical protein